MKKLTHLSLFSGIGGLDLTAEWAGIETIGQCEWADYPTKVLEKHWPAVPRWRDIRELSADKFYQKTGKREVTVISGGFPCQPHSLAGKRMASNDERDLWGEFRRIICEIRPRWIVAENVRGLLSSESGKFFGRVLRDLANSGYDAWWYCFPSSAAGTAFEGKRVAIVAKATSVRWGGMEKERKIRPDEKYLENVGAWKARQNDILSHMGKPDILPERRHSRNDDGLPKQMDRIKCLGNSVVPQQFYPIFKAIAEMEELQDDPVHGGDR